MSKNKILLFAILLILSVPSFTQVSKTESNTIFKLFKEIKASKKYTVDGSSRYNSKVNRFVEKTEYYYKKEKKIEDVKRDIASLEREMSLLSVRNERLEKELILAKNALEKFSSEIEDLKKEIEMIYDTLSELAKENATLAKSFEELAKDFNSILGDINNRNTHLENKIFSLQNKLDAEIQSDNQISLETDVIFTNKARIVYRLDSLVVPKKVHSFFLTKNFKYKEFRNDSSEKYEFDKNCYFLIYDKTGERIYSHEIYFSKVVENKTNTISFSPKSTKLPDKDRLIQLEEKYDKNEIENFKFLVVEKRIYDKNVDQFKHIEEALLQRLLMKSKNTNHYEKAIDRGKEDCQYCKDVFVNNTKVEISLYDRTHDDGDSVIFYNSETQNKEALYFLENGASVMHKRFVNVSYKTMLKFQVNQAGKGNDNLVTLGLKINDIEYSQDIKKGETYCVNIFIEE